MKNPRKNRARPSSALNLICRLTTSVVVIFLAQTDPSYARVADNTRDCLVGAYRDDHGGWLALTLRLADPQGIGFATIDGRKGALSAQSPGIWSGQIPVESPKEPNQVTLSHTSCRTSRIEMRFGEEPVGTWTRVPIKRHYLRFKSGTLTLAGELMTPASVSVKPPLLIITHGSESNATLDVYPLPLLLAGQGITTFIYDKRGTGQSEGVYTQNFVSLGEDASAAVREAGRLLRGHVGRVGIYGPSQGTWIAPLAADKTGADFVVAAYGVVGTPIEQDQWDVSYELANLIPDTPPDAEAQAAKITAETARIAASNFQPEPEVIAALKASYGRQSWFARLQGQYTGEILRGQIDQARRESPGVIWNYDTLAVMRRLRIPQLWIQARDDATAPSAPSRARLERLRDEGYPIDIAVFPDTDHGMRRFQQDTDGRRSYYGIAPFFMQLVIDWVKGEFQPPYGNAVLSPFVGRAAILSPSIPRRGNH